MLVSINLFYLCMKMAFFYSLIRIQIKFDPLKDRYLFLGILYTSGVAFLSYVYIVSWQATSWAPWQVKVAVALGVSPWVAWLGETLLLSTFYFRLMSRFDEGVIFWTLLLLGIPLVYF